MRGVFDPVHPRAFDFIELTRAPNAYLVIDYCICVTDDLHNDFGDDIVYKYKQRYRRKTISYDDVCAIRLDTHTAQTGNIDLFLPDGQFTLVGFYLPRLYEPLRQRLVRKIVEVPMSEAELMGGPDSKYPDGFCCVTGVKRPTQRELAELGGNDANRQVLN